MNIACIIFSVLRFVSKDWKISARRSQFLDMENLHGNLKDSINFMFLTSAYAGSPIGFSIAYPDVNSEFVCSMRSKAAHQLT